MATPRLMVIPKGDPRVVPAKTAPEKLAIDVDVRATKVFVLFMMCTPISLQSVHIFSQYVQFICDCYKTTVSNDSALVRPKINII